MDVDIFYERVGQVTGRPSRVALEVLDKTWHEGKDDLGYPLVHLLVKAGLEQHDPASVEVECRGRVALAGHAGVMEGPQEILAVIGRSPSPG